MPPTLHPVPDIPGDRHDPPPADPVTPELRAALDDAREMWEDGWNACARAYGGPPKRTPQCPARAGARPDYLRAVPDETRLLMTAAGLDAILDASK